MCFYIGDSSIIEREILLISVSKGSSFREPIHLTLISKKILPLALPRMRLLFSKVYMISYHIKTEMCSQAILEKNADYIYST